MLDFENYPVIAAVKSKEDFYKALDSEVQTVFLLSSNIINIDEFVKAAHLKEKLIFVHMDFVDGLSKDAEGVKYLATKNIDGIISTRSNIIATAHDCGISSIQRFFMIDSRSVDTAVESLQQSRADMAELMPGVASKAIKTMRARTRVPLIAGGLIDEKTEIIAALSAGASAISTGNVALWDQ